MHWRWTGRDGCGHSSPWAIFGSSPAGVGIFAFGRHALCGGLRILGRYGSLRVMLGLARLRTSSLRWHSLLCRGLGFAVHPQVRVFPALSAVGWACCGGCGWGAVAHCMFLATRRPRRWRGRQVRMRGLYTARRRSSAREASRERAGGNSPPPLALLSDEKIYVNTTAVLARLWCLYEIGSTPPSKLQLLTHGFSEKDISQHIWTINAGGALRLVTLVD